MSGYIENLEQSVVRCKCCYHHRAHFSVCTQREAENGRSALERVMALKLHIWSIWSLLSPQKSLHGSPVPLGKTLGDVVPADHDSIPLHLVTPHPAAPTDFTGGGGGQEAQR